MQFTMRCKALVLTALLVACGDDSSGHRNDLTADTGPAPDSGTSMPGSSKSPATEPSAKPDAGHPQTTDTVMKAPSCDDLKCTAPATCSVSDGKPHCSCPTGFNDTKGDASQCEDKDECAKATDNDCGAHAHCKNEPGKYSCVCDAPAYSGDGKKCGCATGYTEKEGLCLADDGGACGDDIDCANNHCVSQICCAQSCNNPSAQCFATKGATCEDGHTCKYPIAADGSACEDADACTTGSTCKAGKCEHGTVPVSCDDGNPCTDDSCDMTRGCKNQNNTAGCDDKNPCTQHDTCAAGSCLGKDPVDCSGQNDACNTGECDPANGSCKKKPVADGKTCDDGQTCTVTDQCAAGACAGQGNACGPNATSCTNGSPNVCQCAANYHAKGSLCVPDNDECATNNGGCDPNADCFDRSNDPNTVSCTCKADYIGDGKTCVLANPCAKNPCGEGRGTCTNAPAGKHTCACAPGYTVVAGTCVCDMTGTFAVRNEVKLSWASDSSFEGGSDTTYSWSIERQSYDAQGNIQAETIPCGESNMDLCGLGVPALRIPVEAYSQYVPLSAWIRLAAAPSEHTYSLPAPLPGSEYKPPQFSVLQGIVLADPFGPWPPSRKDVQGGNDFDGSAVNGARWADTDNDTFFGLTTYAVGPQGAPADGSPTAPIEGFGTTSRACPRGNPNAARSPYNYPPALDTNLTPRRVKRFSSANRTIGALEGTINSCDLITGNVIGSDKGFPAVDIRIGSCVRVDESNGGEVACSSAVLDFLDGTKTTNQFAADTFIMKRVSNSAITCEQVRAMTF